MIDTFPSLLEHKKLIEESKYHILKQWLSYKAPKEILQKYDIDENFFIQKYASGVFDYFMGVISNETKIGDCPVMQELLNYLKFHEVSADQLFEICNHFRRSMVDFSYDMDINSKEYFKEISYVFDKNFTGILKYYTDTIFNKLVDARQEALQAGQAKDYFLSNMSHEIRTPLNAILGFVNLLIEDDVPKKHKNYLDIIASSGETLLSIINDILDFSKLRSGEFTIEPKVFSLHDELNHTLELFVASANSKDITITSYIDPGIPKELYGDSLRIKQVLSNFLSNAIKFTPVNGRIDVEAECTNKRLKVCVKDSGIGIDKEQLSTIFSAFVQAKQGENTNGGTGLGLSISSQLAELMGGEVSVSSTPNEGSTFSIEVPIEVYTQECLMFDDIEDFRKLKMLIYAKEGKLSFRENSFLRYAEFFQMDITVSDKLHEQEYDLVIFADATCDAEFKKNIKDSEKKFMALMNKESDFYDGYANVNYLCFPLYCSKIHRAFKELMQPEVVAPHKEKIMQKFEGHILVAEDNEPNQELIKILLSRYGLTYDIVENGLEAFKMFQSKRYDLVLMDEQMPVMDGNEAVAKILEYEKEKNLEHTPISALTANVIKGAKERGLLSGYDAFLGKPVVLKELERVFVSFLNFNNSFSSTPQEPQEQQSILGLNAEKLQKELMLSSDELLMLLSMFLKKMSTSLPELQNAIVRREYKKIAHIAHSIKGSSGNFRIESLQRDASEMEKMARVEDESFDYEACYELMKATIDAIEIL